MQGRALMKHLNPHELPRMKFAPRAHFDSTYTNIGMLQRRLERPLPKDDMQVHEVFCI